MIAWIDANWLTIVVALIVAAIAVLCIRNIIKGETRCAGCAGCSKCGSCTKGCASRRIKNEGAPYRTG